YAYNGEAGVRLNFNDKVILKTALYYTYLNNALVRRNFELNGETQIMYAGEMSTVQAIQNAAKAWIYGFEADLEILFTGKLKLQAQYNIVKGTERDDSGVEVPVSHTPSDFVNTHIIRISERTKLDVITQYSGKLA